MEISILFQKLPQQFIENLSKEILSDKCQERNGSKQELEVNRNLQEDVVYLLKK